MRLKEGMKGDEDDDVKQIGSTDPIGDFKKMTTDRKVDKVVDAIKQMTKVILKLI